MTTRLLPGLLTALVLVCTTATAHAAPVTRWFEFSSTTGPLQFGPTIGRLTYDDALAPPVGRVVTGDDLLLDLELRFAGQTWTEQNTDSVMLRFDSDQRLLEVLLGANCQGQSGSCSLTAGTDEWYLRAGVQGTINDFAYVGFGSGDVRQQSRFVNRLLDAAPAAVPETPTPALATMALALLVLTRRHRGIQAPPRPSGR